jgi:hypothetical protein
MKAWAAYFIAHLGLIPSKTPSVVHLRWTVVSNSHVNKTNVRRGSPVAVAISSFPASCLYLSERGGWSADRPEERRRRASAHRRATLTRG